jgi:putative FmdB family regulatory protein
MPIYSYQCIYCNKEFDEFRKNYKGSGKSLCPKCGNVAFKIPAVFSPKIFKKREFADGTSTPHNVNTPNQEKAWMKSEGIVYDAPIVTKTQLKRERRKKTETVMEAAFRKAHDKAKQGYKIHATEKRIK